MSQWDLKALEVFNAVVAAGGLGKAARLTDRPKATLSRQVRELEENLGVRLFDRNTRVLRLTDEGRLLHEKTQAALHDLAEARQLVVEGGARPRGTLRVSVPVTLAHVFLGKLAAEFVALYPEVRLEMRAEDRQVDLIEDGYDVVIRVNPSERTDLVGRRFGRDEVLIVAPPALPRPKAGGEIPSVDAVLNMVAPAPEVWRCVDASGPLAVRPRARLSLSSLLMVRDAVLAGAGIAQLPLSVVCEDLGAGRLSSWGRVPDRAVELWVLHHSRRLTSLKISRFVDFICDEFPARMLVGRTPDKAARS